MSQAGIASDSTGPGADVETLTGNSGGAVPPTGGNINVVGDNSEGIDIVGNPGTSTLTVAFSDSTDQPFAFLEQVNIGELITSSNYNLNIEEDINGTVGMSIRNSNNGVGAITELFMTSDFSNADVDIILDNSSKTWVYGINVSDSSAFVISFDGDLDTDNCIRLDPTNGQVKFNNAYTFPITDGTAGQYLGTNGAGVLSFSSPNDSLTYTAVNSTPYVVLSTDQFLGVNTGTAKTVQLPNAPSTGRVFVIKDATGTANANNITVTTVGGVVNIDGATTYAINQNYASIQVLFNGTSYLVF